MDLGEDVPMPVDPLRIGPHRTGRDVATQIVDSRVQGQLYADTAALGDHLAMCPCPVATGC